jgi:hypothetical protein
MGRGWRGEQTFNITQRKSFPSKTVRCTVDVYDRLFTKDHPDHFFCVGMPLLELHQDLIDSLNRRLPKGIYIRRMDLPEVDCPSHFVFDVVRFSQPLIGLEEHTVLIVKTFHATSSPCRSHTFREG